MHAALGRCEIAEDALPSIVALLTMTGLSQLLAVEGALGVTAGHDTTLEFVEHAIEQRERGNASSRQPGMTPRGRGTGRSV